MRLATSPTAAKAGWPRSRAVRIAWFAPDASGCAPNPCFPLKWRQRCGNELTIGCRHRAKYRANGMTASSNSATEDTRERLRYAARLSEKTETPGIRAELRADRGDHRRITAARGAPRVVVGDVAQPAGEDAAARGLPRRGLHRDPARGWEERAVQEDEVGARTVAPELPASSRSSG